MPLFSGDNKKIMYKCDICVLDRNMKYKISYKCGHNICRFCHDRQKQIISKGHILSEPSFKCHVCRTIIKSLCDKRTKTFLASNTYGIPEGHMARSCLSCGVIFTEKVGCGNTISMYCNKHRMDNNDYKTCPKCKVVIHRTSGCDHIKCTNCNTRWCWGCKYIFTPFCWADKKLFYSQLDNRYWNCAKTKHLPFCSFIYLYTIMIF
jgi:hypothetical protein